MLSKKSKYALKAMLVLAKEYGQGPVLISDMAQREGIPRKFLELILLELKNQGLLQSKKGKGGGYFLRARASPDQRRAHNTRAGRANRAVAMRQQDRVHAMPRMPRRA